jgi:hypothetical protein
MRIAVDFEKALANIVNQPGLNQVITPDADPLSCRRSRSMAAGRARCRRRELVRRTEPDPLRTAAAIGTSVIQEHRKR